MRSASGQRLLAGVVVAAIAGIAWWIAASDRGPRVAPVSNGAARSESERERSGDAPPAAPPDSPLVADRSLDVDRSRGATRRLLHGFVVDRAGTRVDDAVIAWSESAALPPTNDYKRRITASGEYALPGLPAAAIGFRVTATGCATLEVALDLSKGGRLRHDFVLDRSTLVTVHVRKPDGATIQGEPLPLPNAIWDDSFESLAVVATDEPIVSLPPTSQRSYERQGIGLGEFHHPSSPGRRSAVEMPADAFGVLE